MKYNGDSHHQSHNIYKVALSSVDDLATRWTENENAEGVSGQAFSASHQGLSLFVEPRRRGGVNGVAGQEIGVADSKRAFFERIDGFMVGFE